MRTLLAPAAHGLNAARHLLWYFSYQVSGESRPR
jgi:succinate dehydrogenase/fumarate reductase cytochrome b subunit